MENEIIVDHLHGSNGVTEKIRKAMYNAAREFVYIGFLLYEVQEYKYYEEAGFSSVYEYAEFELGFKRTSTKNFIAIAREFGTSKQQYQGRAIETQTMSLQPAYEKFNYSQLVELLAMSSTQREKAKPDMTIKQLRQLKKEPESQTDNGQTSDHPKNGIACTVNNRWKDLDKTDVKTLCFMTGKRFNTRSNYEIVIKPIEKPKDKLDLKRRLCEMAGIEFDPANYDYGISVQLIEK